MCTLKTEKEENKAAWGGVLGLCRRGGRQQHDATAKLGMQVVDTSVRQRDHRARRESARGMGNAHAHVVNAPAESSRRKHRDEET